MQSDFSSASSADSSKEFDSAHVSMDLAHGHTFQEPTEPAETAARQEPAPTPQTSSSTTTPPSTPAPAVASAAAAAPPPVQDGSNSHKWWLIGGIVGAILLLIPLVFFVFFYDDGSDQEPEDDDTTQIVEEEPSPEPTPEPEEEPQTEPEPEPEPEPAPEPPIVTVDSLETEESQPTVTGTVDDSSASVEVEINGRSYVASVDPDGDWRAVVSAELDPGTYEVTATADNGEEATDNTNNELEILQPPEPVEEPSSPEKEEEK